MNETDHQLLYPIYDLDHMLNWKFIEQFVWYLPYVNEQIEAVVNDHEVIYVKFKDHAQIDVKEFMFFDVKIKKFNHQYLWFGYVLQMNNYHLISFILMNFLLNFFYEVNLVLFIIVFIVLELSLFFVYII
jgi:hypothetical protein